MNLRLSEDIRAVSLKKTENETLHIDEAASQTVKMRFFVSSRRNILYDRIKIFQQGKNILIESMTLRGY